MTRVGAPTEYTRTTRTRARNVPMYVIYYCIMLAVSTTRNAKLVVKFLPIEARRRVRGGKEDDRDGSHECRHP